VMGKVAIKLEGHIDHDHEVNMDEVQELLAWLKELDDVK